MRDKVAWDSFFEWIKERKAVHAELIVSTPTEDLAILKGMGRELAETEAYARLPMREEEEDAFRRTG